MRWLLLCLILFVAISMTGLWQANQLSKLSQHDKMARILLLNGYICSPKIIDVEQEGLFRVVCADGKFHIQSLISCESGYLCQMGFDASCWEVEPI